MTEKDVGKSCGKIRQVRAAFSEALQALQSYTLSVNQGNILGTILGISSKVRLIVAISALALTVTRPLSIANGSKPLSIQETWTKLLLPSTCLRNGAIHRLDTTKVDSRGRVVPTGATAVDTTVTRPLIVATTAHTPTAITLAAHVNLLLIRDPTRGQTRTALTIHIPGTFLAGSLNMHRILT